MANLQIEQPPNAALRVQRQNACAHPKRQTRQIADLIERFGFCNPILLDDDLSILAGHGPLSAAELLELSGVTTVWLWHLSKTDKGDYVIADNLLAENAGWDRSPPAIELQSLNDTGFEVGQISSSAFNRS